MKQGRDADVAGISRTVLALTKCLHLALTVWIHTDTCISVSRRDTRVEIFEIRVPAHIYHAGYIHHTSCWLWPFKCIFRLIRRLNWLFCHD